MKVYFDNFFVTILLCFKDIIYVLQYGMLIEFLFEKFPIVEVVNDQAIGDLEVRQKFWKFGQIPEFVKTEYFFMSLEYFFMLHSSNIVPCLY